MSLPRPEATEAEVAAWVRVRLELLDRAPAAKGWRHRALGMTRAEAIAQAGRDVRVDLRIPLGEVRIVHEVCRRREIGARAYLRRALGTMLVVCDGVEPAELPYLTSGGLLGP